MSYIKFVKPQKALLISIIILIFMLVLSLILISRKPDPKIRRVNPQLEGFDQCGDTFCYSWLKGKNGILLSLVEGQKLEEISSQHASFDKYFYGYFRLMDRFKSTTQTWTVLLKYRVLAIQESLEVIQAKVMMLLEAHIWKDNLALIQGFVFGDDDQISQDTGERFRLFGLYHVLAASGSNLSLWILPLTLIIPLYSRKTAFFATSFWAGIYLLLLGNNPPVARAVSMLILGQLGSKLFLKQVNRERLLLVSALILLCFSSSYLTSLSFWMSILATWSMIIFMADGSFWLQFLLGEGVPRVGSFSFSFLLESYQASWAAQLILAPIFVWFFKEFSWIGLVVGPLFLPLVEVAIQLSFSLVFLAGFALIFPWGELFLSVISKFYIDLAGFILWLFDLIPPEVGVWEFTTRGSQVKFLSLWAVIFVLVIATTRKKPGRKDNFFYE